MAAFTGLEFTMVANDFDADVFFMRFFDILLTYDELFCGGDGAHGKYWELPSSLKPKFRRALARSDELQPPLMVAIDFPNADMPTYGWVRRSVVFHYTHTDTDKEFHYKSTFMYSATTIWNWKIKVRRTSTYVVQLHKCDFPAPGIDWMTFDSLIIPARFEIINLSGDVVCSIDAALGTRGKALALAILDRTNKSPAWDIVIVNHKGELLGPFQPIGHWAFGAQRFLFATPKWIKSTPEEAWAAFLLNPCALSIRA